MAVTEFGYLVVRPGLDAMDETTEAGMIVAKVYHDLAREETGPYCVYYGREVENPDNFWAFFDFESVEHHKKFAVDRGIHIVKGFEKVFSSSGFQKHLGNEAFPPTALEAPVTELVMFYFAPDMSAEAKAAVSGQVALFQERALTKCADVQAVNVGWNLENDFRVPGDDEGRQASVLTMLVGWPSVDAHMEFRGSEPFKESIGLLVHLEGVIKMTVCHIKCKVLKKQVRT